VTLGDERVGGPDGEYVGGSHAGGQCRDDMTIEHQQTVGQHGARRHRQQAGVDDEPEHVIVREAWLVHRDGRAPFPWRAQSQRGVRRHVDDVAQLETGLGELPQPAPADGAVAPAALCDVAGER